MGRNRKERLQRLGGLFVLTLFFLSCGGSGDKPTEPVPAEGAVSLKLAVPRSLDVARVEYAIGGAGMDTLRGELGIEDGMARGRVTGIPAGEDRMFRLDAYGAEGDLTYSGSARADVVAGSTIEVRVELLPVGGAADIEGAFGDFLPLPPTDLPLIGKWRLDLPGVSTETLDFAYDFKEDGRFTNAIGGAFLAPLKELDQLADVDLGNLEQLDGARLKLKGTWRAAGSVLLLDFDELEVELIGRLPLIGEVSVTALDEQLENRAEFQLGYSYRVQGDRLYLDGDALTLGVDVGDVVEDNPIPEGVSDVGKQALSLIGSYIGDRLQGQNLDEFTLDRIE